MRGRRVVLAMFTVLAATSVAVPTPREVRAGFAPTIDLAVSATCEGVVSATYSYLLNGGRSLTAGSLSFTRGADVVSVALPDIASSPTDQTVTGTQTSSGYAEGDVVIVSVAYVESLVLNASGVTTVTIPECPVVTDPPATDPPATEPGPTDTSPVDESVPGTTTTTSALPGSSTIPVTLPTTGRGDSGAAGVVGVALAAVGVALLLLARRPRSLT